jgi:hypothetical protein
MEPLLTLVIALGGIATGIGAIWAALVAKRQAQLTERSLSEQRQFLKEQNEIARSQAQLTERSLAQTERSLAEQNERLRHNVALDLLSRLQDRFDSPYFLRRRKAAARWLLDNVLVDDDIVEVERVNKAVWDMLDFFEELGHFQKTETLQVESVQISFGWYALVYWLLCKHAIQKLRERFEDPELYAEVEYLGRLVSDINRERGVKPPTQGQLRETMEDEAALDEEPPTTTE